ncbi:hypothetical protein K2173_025010 [Erythroxylum novogranatense]|uniref:Trichome birefringence-like N-terminal domain-containing protein n=1 Tax=Erythroxylum novogranatense TaxID=1862640 RepID=A0AAV8UCU9_9ROSI|nr:hypothetical protein K2173_025010 [Erythroxylum novogranatense]
MNFGVQRFCLFLSIAIFLSSSVLCLQANSVNFHVNTGKVKNLRKPKKTTCNLYQGMWVYDPVTFPLYDSATCPFIRKEYDCLKYGRPDHFYLHYKWKPTGCDLPRFNGRDFLARFRGKKIMYVGDSVSVNHFESLLCLLHSVVPDLRVTSKSTNTTLTVTFRDYEVSIVMFLTHYLVDIEEEKIGRVLKLDSLKSVDVWKQADVLIFNTWLWWYRGGSKQPWDYVQEGDTIVKDMDRMAAFRKGLTKWAKWVDSDVDTTKTRVLFQGISPSHYKFVPLHNSPLNHYTYALLLGKDWNETGVTNCGKETKPLSGSLYPGGSPLALNVVDDVLSSIKKPIHLLNITTLSQLRKDAHPSSYNGFKAMDCTHWCIAGVPDTWNELLYAALILD